MRQMFGDDYINDLADRQLTPPYDPPQNIAIVLTKRMLVKQHLTSTGTWKCRCHVCDKFCFWPIKRYAWGIAYAPISLFPRPRRVPCAVALRLWPWQSQCKDMYACVKPHPHISRSRFSNFPTPSPLPGKSGPTFLAKASRTMMIIPSSRRMTRSDIVLAQTTARRCISSGNWIGLSGRPKFSAFLASIPSIPQMRSLG